MTGRIVFTAVLAIGLVGCATLLQSRQQQVAFNTTPAGATVLINGQDRGLTPVTLQLVPTDAYAIGFTLPGYAPYTQPLSPVVSTCMKGTLSFHCHELPQVVNVTLRPVR